MDNRPGREGLFDRKAHPVDIRLPAVLSQIFAKDSDAAGTLSHFIHTADALAKAHQGIVKLIQILASTRRHPATNRSRRPNPS